MRMIMDATTFHTKFVFSSLSPFIQKVVHPPLLTSAKSLYTSNKFNQTPVFSLIKAQPFKILPTKPLNHLKDSIFFHSNSSQGMLGKVLVVLLVSGLAWAFPALLPPPPRICGSPDGPTVTGPRIKLRDGRHLAYKEHGVPKETAKYKVVYAHSFGSTRYESAIASLETLEELGAYVVSFDRPGYGESDPHPKRTIQTTALDMEELADQLGLGPKFYVMGYSMGGHSVWGCLEYIPNRLAGAALVAPVVNYWWPSFPANLSTEGYNLQLPQDQWALRVAHYAPWLVYWWNTQKWFPYNSVLSGKLKMSPPDLEVVSRSAKHANEMQKLKEYAVKQGVFESLHRDMMVGFGKWDFDPMDLKNLFSNGSVHLWHGDEDWVVPVILQRYVVERLPWINYHEIPNVGHLVMHDPAMKEVIWKTFLTGEKEQTVHS
ncbi:uncharacterized protein LOC125844692 isoform X1 [Solanum stenotomum]|uniref:uncharacterized protein LOC125844692 isoform X1 n=2 Tax=Solanum stenotomum TaxID=172797 RepID=UPI0020D0780E|nr:uncharacterized protein LOC125844692 isoform X1 [Solanum stenotomum]